MDMHPLYDHSLVKEMDERWKESQPLWQQWWYEADLDTKMVTGQQDYWNTFYNVNYRNQKILMFNKILRVRNMISGYQRKNRLSSICMPTDNGSEETADQFTKVLDWVHTQDDTYEKYSMCFEGAIDQGLCLLSMWMDFREDPENGMIRTAKVPFNAFLMDNYWTDKGLTDCDWIWTRKYMTRQQILSLYPKIGKDLMSLQKGYGAKDGRFQFLAQNWYQYQQDLFAYDEYWKRDYRKVRKVLDKSTGDIADWNGTKEQFQLFRTYNPNLELITAQKPTVKLHVLVNNHLVYEEKSPYGIDSYPFIPSVGYHFPEVQNFSYRYMGVTRNIRDSQIELNRRRNRMLDILDAQVQSGLIIKEDALVNPEDAYKQGPGQVLFAKQNTNLQADILPIQPPQIPPSMFELQKMLEEEIMSIAGVNEELFGENTNGNDVSGLLHQMRVGSGLVSLQPLFDNFNTFQRQAGNVMLEMIQANFGVGKIKKILNKEPTEEFYDQEFELYRCKVEEGMLTSTQQQMQFAQALQLREMGVPIPSSYLLEKATLSGKKELVQAVQKQEEQQQQMQQAQMQAELEKNQMLGRSLEAKAQSDFAMAEDHKTQAVANIGKAYRDHAQADADVAKTKLENIKTIKELEGLPQERLIKLAEFFQNMQTQEHEQLMREREQDFTEEDAIANRVKEREKATAPS